ncbi:3-oxoacyl-[acyl-carrier-protein] synthase 3 protein 5 [Streptomyces humidus]|uniref:3-oxoacyl-[acyl-carrier-protein] synthase 3 protein 5 n=1 Tax=Streptomyces humidus TaxID=52259 RepID=A0A918L5V1_9ACTN|nr:ketoacyl-ACP synthase III family protein [Streptomyces humidus]GGS05434.1 3-oxoacyl-[acyl-carrier-protein] synthase 3 protein 5 [Streptomyces humidus]
MRYEDLFIAGVGSFLPKAVDVEEAVAAGDYDVEEQRDSGQRSVTVAGPDDSQPDMAVRAGREALRRAGHDPADVALLLHAVTCHNGLDGWNAAAYLQRRLLDGGGVSFEIRQLSNGALGSVELAAAYLSGAPGRNAAVITAADRFAPPAWDRWRSQWGLVFGDGASAAVLSRSGGFARVRSAVTVCDTELEVLHRGTLPFTAAATQDPVDFRARTLDSSLLMDFGETERRITAGLRTAAGRALAEAGAEPAAVKHCVVPHFGRELLRRQCLEPLGIEPERTTWEFGAQVGHLGAADQFAGLAYLAESGQLAAGDQLLLVSMGGGFTWTCVVADVVTEPSWAL